MTGSLDPHSVVLILQALFKLFGKRTVPWPNARGRGKHRYCHVTAAVEQPGLLKGPTAMIIKAHQRQQSSGATSLGVHLMMLNTDTSLLNRVYS